MQCKRKQKLSHGPQLINNLTKLFEDDINSALSTRPSQKMVSITEFHSYYLLIPSNFASKISYMTSEQFLSIMTRS